MSYGKSYSDATGISVTTGTTYPITVGGGGGSGSHPNYNDGSNSVFSTIPSTGGGAGGGKAVCGSRNGGPGGGALGGYGGNHVEQQLDQVILHISAPQGGNGGTGTLGEPSYDGGNEGGSVVNGSNGWWNLETQVEIVWRCASRSTGSNVQAAAVKEKKKKMMVQQQVISGTGGSGGRGSSGSGTQIANGEQQLQQILVVVAV